MIQTFYKCDICGNTVSEASLYYAKFTNLEEPGDKTSCDICNICLNRLMERAREKLGIDRIKE